MADDDPTAGLLAEFESASARYRAAVPEWLPLTKQWDEVENWTCPSIYQLRLGLLGSDDMVWRSLELRADATLDDLHKVLQVVFGWDDIHLHQFVVPVDDGTDEGSMESIFPPVADVADAEWSTWNIRIDEVMTMAGHVVLYRYGVEEPLGVLVGLDRLRPAEEDAILARCIAGQGVAPEEDAEPARQVQTSVQIDVDAINMRLRAVSEVFASDARLVGEGLRYILCWPEEQFASLCTRWPKLTEYFYDLTHDEHLDIIVGEHFEAWMSGLVPVTAHGDVEVYEKYCFTKQLDPSDTLSVLAYAAHAAADGELFHYPPASDDPCWCGSQSPYALCCADR